MADSKKAPTEIERAARQAAALRENLKRRKQQARERAAAERPIDVQARGRAVRDFWFGAPDSPDFGRWRYVWFERDEAFDRLCADFRDDHERAARGDYDAVAERPAGAVALVLLLDQFPRNLFRGTVQAFATDARARATAARAVDAGMDRLVLPVERMFLYLPFQHCESLENQRRSVDLFESLPLTPEFSAAERDHAVDYAHRHKAIIERFGRFPHRNAALGRASTPEEIAFLAEPNSSF
jgi:uncharacterized protein (DUF924 family)